jgi:hypothetical protein
MLADELLCPPTPQNWQHGIIRCEATAVFRSELHALFASFPGSSLKATKRRRTDIQEDDSVIRSHLLQRGSVVMVGQYRVGSLPQPSISLSQTYLSLDQIPPVNLPPPARPAHELANNI